MTYKLGVLAATKCDCKLGVDYFIKNGIKQIASYALSSSPGEQTILQRNRKELRVATIRGIDFLIKRKAQCIVIYCNSLSGSLNLVTLRKLYSIPIITPLDVYKNLAPNYQIFGIFAANSQAVCNLEQAIVNSNPTAIVTSGSSNLAIVKAIEEKTPITTIIRDFKLVNLMKNFAISNCEAVIIGCTHFNYFLPKLQRLLKQLNYQPKLVEPSASMLQMVLKLKEDGQKCAQHR